MLFFFFNDTATTEIYTLSLHDALPICHANRNCRARPHGRCRRGAADGSRPHGHGVESHRSEEHTSELQSQSNLVCRLLLEKKKNKNRKNEHTSASWNCIQYELTLYVQS